MKIKSLMMILMVVSVLISGCEQEQGNEELSELQVTACNTADEAGTCDTKMPELNLVTTGKCCEILEKCC